MKGEGFSQIRTSFMQIFFVINLEFFHPNCRLWTKRQATVAMMETMTIEKVNYTDGPY